MAQNKKNEYPEKIKIMFVCLGNICRSPLAEAVFRSQVSEAGMDNKFYIASSGTGGWHVGEGADKRMRQTALRSGVSLESHEARQLSGRDLQDFDYVFVMDKENLRAVKRLDGRNQAGEKINLFRAYDPDPEDYQVPDPYYGGDGGFDRVFDIVERTSRNLLSQLIKTHALDITG